MLRLIDGRCNHCGRPVLPRVYAVVGHHCNGTDLANYVAQQDKWLRAGCPVPG